jgi:glycosyltransferase involved in cell wall biosynthesis
MDVILSKCHIVALISNFEALPLSIVEAMSCSRAIIATNVGGIPELIKSGLNGILVRPNYVDDVVKALTKCKDEQLRLSFGARAKLIYEERFTDKSMLTSISNTYRSLGLVQNEVIENSS